jgi:hypothetical protein
VSAFANAGTGDSSISTATSSSLLLGPRGARTGTSGTYLGGISFDHLLSYSGAGTNFYSSVPHAWVGLRIVSYPGWETSALVFATRNDTSGTAGTTLERMCVMPNGKVGINTKSPAGMLDIASDATVSYTGTSYSSNYTLALLANSGSGGGANNDYSGIKFSNSNGSREQFFGVVQAASNRGDFVWQSYTGSVYQEGMRLYGNTHTLEVRGDVIAYGSPSDARLKTIKEKVPNSLESVLRLNGYRFDWNRKTDTSYIKEDIGVIAQEVAEVFPELAKTNDDGYMSVRYQGLTAVLIEAVKEQQTQIESQKSQNEELIKRIETLESILQNKGI